MRARSAGLLVVAALRSSAMADAPRTEQPLDAFLEQRVAEELAADGTLLSRLGVTLEIELVGETVIVSLVDSTTQRAVASTKIDRVPGDRDAAVAQVTQIAAGLADQLAHAPPAGDTVLAAGDQRAAAEYAYRENELTFAPGSWGERTPSLGSLHRPLTETQFFDLVERHDLADEYRSRRRHAKIGIAVSVLAVASGGVMFATGQGRADHEGGSYTRTTNVLIFGGFASGVVGLAGFIYGTYRLTHALPVDEGELYQLASEHNRKVRAEVFATETGAGVSVGGAF